MKDCRCTTNVCYHYHYDAWEIERLEFDDVIHAVHESFPGDQGLIIQKLRYSLDGMYRVILTEQVEHKDYTINLKKGEETITVNLYIHRQTQRTGAGHTYKSNTHEERRGTFVLFSDGCGFNQKTQNFWNLWK